MCLNFYIWLILFYFILFCLRFRIFYHAHTYMFSCTISLFLIYRSRMSTWTLQARWGSNDLPYDFQSRFKLVKPFNSLLSASIDSNWYMSHLITYWAPILPSREWSLGQQETIFRVKAPGLILPIKIYLGIQAHNKFEMPVLFMSVKFLF